MENLKVTNLFNYPDNCFLGKEFPKKAFYEHLNADTDFKNEFVTKIEKIYLLYDLKEATLKVEPGENVEEIAFFYFELKQTDLDLEITRFIDKNIKDKYLFYIFHYQDNYRIVANFKTHLEAVRSNTGSFDIKATYFTRWLDKSDLELKLQGSTLDAIYENLFSQIAGLKELKGDALAKLVVLRSQRAKQSKIVEKAKRKQDTEPQYHKQVIYRQEYLEQKNVLDNIDAQIKELENVL